MAIMKMKGLITSHHVGGKTWNNAPVIDKATGLQVIDRSIKVLDLESENTDIYKVKYSEEQEPLVNEFLRKNCVVEAFVGQFNKFTFYNLASLQVIK